MAEIRPSLHVGGVPIDFPVKPYPSQLAMMAQIVKGLRNGENCLLESPTGSGKTLALLCSALAWQKMQKRKIEQYNSLLQQGVTDRDILARVLGEAPPNGGGINSGPPLTTTQPTAPRVNLSEGGFLRSEDYDDNDDFQTTVDSMDSDYMGQALLEDELQNFRRKKTPKIYFGTRTHKQIKQIIKELQSTAYKDVKSLVLGSREHTCIHPIVSKSDKKNEECRLLREDREGSGCTFHHRVSKYPSYQSIQERGLPSVFDLEDLVRMGRKAKFCPYYVSRNLMEEANIIFCPYNYLIDPIIRQSMSINLKDHVMVLDEAHNIEDSAREAASLSFTQGKLIECKAELEKLIRQEFKVQSSTHLCNLLSSVSLWVDSHHARLLDNTSEYNESSLTYTGEEAAQKLDHIGLGPEKLKEHLGYFGDLTEVENPDDVDSPKAPALVSQFLEKLFITLRFLYDHPTAIQDYRMVLKRVQVFGKPKFTQRPEDWIGPRRSRTHEEISVNLWCLNPAVAFRVIGDSTHSIVLTSGTLSPMSSFQSELGVAFPIQLEANHVISRDQVWVGTLAKGPNDKSLLSTFKTTETYAFQDELGDLVLEVCRTVPRGVLCFLPSYSMLDKLSERWQVTGLWERLKEIKVIICEPKKSNELDSVMAVFYQALKESRSGHDSIDGALFLAICRGKVSEGLDFSDDNARAVIAVGIPFPNFKDLQVNLKKQYNDRHSKSLGLLTGNQWYEIQAYRALNQALGRCIRHRYDWGALILVDERYQQTDWYGHTKYTKGLSKWVRNLVRHHTHCRTALTQLHEFTHRMTANPPSASTLDTSLISTPMKPMPPDFGSVASPATPSSSTPKQTSPKRRKVQKCLDNCDKSSKKEDKCDSRFAEFTNPKKSNMSCDSDDMFIDSSFIEFPHSRADTSSALKSPKSTSVLLEEADRILADFGDSDTEDFVMSPSSSGRRKSRLGKPMGVQFIDYDSE